MQKLLIGRVVKPQGIKGEVKVLLLTDGFFSVKNLKEAYIGDKLYKINSIKDAGVQCAFLGLQGVTDRNAAEALRGAEVYADKSLINKDKNAYFIEDLIGLTLYAGEDKIGAIQDVIKSNVDMFVISGVESAGGNDGGNGGPAAAQGIAKGLYPLFHGGSFWGYQYNCRKSILLFPIGT